MGADVEIVCDAVIPYPNVSTLTGARSHVIVRITCIPIVHINIKIMVGTVKLIQSKAYFRHDCWVAVRRNVIPARVFRRRLVVIRWRIYTAAEIRSNGEHVVEYSA